MKLSDGWLLSTNLSLSLLRTISRAASTGMSPGLAPIASPVRIRTATSQVPNTASQAFFTYVCQDVGSHDCAICVFYHIVNFQWFVRVVISKCDIIIHISMYIYAYYSDPKMFKLKEFDTTKNNFIRIVMLHAVRCNLNQATTKHRVCFSVACNCARSNGKCDIYRQT